MNKEKIKYALTRAGHAVWETAAATLPATMVITPQMIKEFDTSIFIAVAAWVLTALLAGVFSFIKSMAAGMPEVKLEQNISMNIPEPEDSYVIEEEGEVTKDE